MGTDRRELDEVLITLTSDIVVAVVGNNGVATADLPSLITNVYGALASLGQATPIVVEQIKPAVAIRTSVKPDYIICLEDGKKLKLLKRHLMARYGLTPDQYRQRWHLPANYPMVAPNYAAKRSELAKQRGLGREPGVKRGRKSAVKG